MTIEEDVDRAIGGELVERRAGATRLTLGLGPQTSLGLPGVLDVDRSKRDPQDRYYSPQLVTDALAQIYDLEAAGDDPAPLHAALRAAETSVLEPSAGGGALLRGLAEVMARRGHYRASWKPERVVACDLDPRPDRPLGFDNVAWYQADFRDRPWGAKERFGLSIQNPPFNLAEESIRQSREIARFTLALVRLTFLESDGRAKWLSEDAPDVYVLARRPKFIGTTHTDSVTCAWLLWLPGPARTFGRFRVLP